MKENKRKSERIPVAVMVRVLHESFGELTLKARDISDGGMFIFGDGNKWPPLGETIQVQALDTPEEATILNAKIVRQMAKGVGVMFCD